MELVPRHRTKTKNLILLVIALIKKAYKKLNDYNRGAAALIMYSLAFGQLVSELGIWQVLL